MVTVRSSPVIVMTLVTGVGNHVEVWLVDEESVSSELVVEVEVEGAEVVVGGTVEDATSLLLSAVLLAAPCVPDGGLTRGR